MLVNRDDYHFASLRVPFCVAGSDSPSTPTQLTCRRQFPKHASDRTRWLLSPGAGPAGPEHWQVESAFPRQLDPPGRGSQLTGDCHPPNWGESPEEFSKLLERLFRHSPPTALIVDETARHILGVIIRTGPKRPDFMSGGILS